MHDPAPPPVLQSSGFVSSEKFIEEHGGKIGDVSVYGQESNPTTWRLATMNMAIRGIDFNFGKQPANSFTSDAHPDLRADYVMANPPIFVSDKALAAGSSAKGESSEPSEEVGYRDIPGFCQSASLDEIAERGYVLTPDRYVGAEEVEDDGVPFAAKMSTLTAELADQFAESANLERAIRTNMKALGFELPVGAKR